MDTGGVFMSMLLLLFPVLGQIFDNNLGDILFVGDHDFGAICRIRININDSCMYIELPGHFYPTDIDYDRVDDTIYWINGNNEIRSAKLSGNSEITVSTLADHGQIYGIAVDSVSRLLFYTDSKIGLITVVGLENFLHKPIISGLVNPRGIVLDRIHGTIYWADSGSPAKIEKSNYDGTNRHELVNSGLVSPSGIDVDVNAGILYWCGNQTIERVNVDGSNRSIVYQLSDKGYGCSIALYQSYLYFTELYRYQLMRIGTDGGGLIPIDYAVGMPIRAIHVNIKELLGINGCSNVNGGCSHFCFPLPGGNIICACPNLMTLQPDGQTCRQDSPLEVLLISYYYGFVSGTDIRENYTHFIIPLLHPTYAKDIDYDQRTDEIYWVQEWKHIYSSKIFENNEITSQFMNKNALIHGIAVDSSSRLLFYTDNVNYIIAVINLQDFSQKTIISSGLFDIQDIAVDPINGIIYWLNSGRSKIEKSNYDGSNRQVVVGTDLGFPFDIQVDFKAGLLYWCDISKLRIERSNVDGSNRSIIYQAQGTFIPRCSIALFQTFIFFTGIVNRYDIMRIGTDGSGLTNISAFVDKEPRAIHVTIKGSLGNNGCSTGNDGCSHFCFPKPDGNHVCDCPNFMFLQSDRKTCQLDGIPEKFLLIPVESRPYIYRMDITNYSYVTIPTQTGHNNPIAVDYDPNTALMFWTDGDSQLFSGSIYFNNQSTLQYRKPYGAFRGIAVDVISRLLFYTDPSRNVIGVICLKRGLHKMIIDVDIYEPHAIVTDSNNSSIYWSSFNKIENSNYDGTSRRKIVDIGTNNSVDLALDINEGVLFWCHYNTRKIEVANVNGSNRQVLFEDQTSISHCCIALYESHLYYTDSGMRILLRLGTNGSGMTFIGNSLSYIASNLYMYNTASRKPGVNMCSKDNGGCSHLCLPRPGGSKVCDCPDNMTLQQDGLTCGNYALPENCILLVAQDYSSIFIVDIPSYRYIRFGYENLFRPSSVAYDPVNLEFYWTDVRFRRIMVSSANGNVKRTVKQLSRSANPVGIALDVQSMVLFYVDNKNGIIAALSLDGSMQKTIVNGSFSNPSYIAIDPLNGAIYWICKEMSHKIEKSNYDGTNRQELISFGSLGLSSFAIDITAGFIYWSNETAIERCNVNGTNRLLIFQDKSATFHGIALFQSNIYIRGIQQNRWTFIKIGRDGSNPVQVGSSIYGYDPYIVAHSTDSASTDSNACSNKNGGCSHFCFPSTVGLYVCACPDGQVLRRNDSHTCRSYLDVCDDHPCNNSGNCTNVNGTYLCNCSRGWQGENCSTAQNTVDKAHGEVFIILITVGSVLVLFAVVFLLCCLKRRSDRCKKKEDGVYDDVQMRETNQAEHEYNQIVVNSNIYYNTVNI